MLGAPYPKIPQVPASGYKVRESGETTKGCLTFSDRPTTPHNIKKYRNSYHSTPGTRVVHHGLIDDTIAMNESRKSLHPELQIYGASSKGSDHVTDIFKDIVTGPVKDQIDAEKERVYKSTNVEPLGRSMVRNHILPEETKKKEFAFGYKRRNTDPPAKELIQPRLEYDNTHHAQYVKSHNAYLPGEQKSLNYKWPGINPTTFKFGKVEKDRLPNGVGAMHCLKPLTNPENQINCITNKRVEDKKMTSDKLGQCKNLGLGDRQAPKDNIFGVMKSKHVDTWNAGDCLYGDYTYEQQLPDQDLGCSTTVGWRNISATDRSYGCPSVRRDVPPPVLRSIADCQNYGDDPSACGLLYPSRFQYRGVTDNDFIQTRSKGDLKNLFGNCGYNLNEDDFNRIYNEAASLSLVTPQGHVSIEEFRQVMNRLMDS